MRARNRTFTEVTKKMIEIVCNDRLGKKIRVKCNADDTVGDLKKLIAAHIGLSPTRHSNASPCLPPRQLTISFPPFSASSFPVCRHKAGEDPPPKVVHCLQGPHYLGRLRDTRLDEPRDVLQLSAVYLLRRSAFIVPQRNGSNVLLGLWKTTVPLRLSGDPPPLFGVAVTNATAISDERLECAKGRAYRLWAALSNSDARKRLCSKDEAHPSKLAVRSSWN